MTQIVLKMDGSIKERAVLGLMYLFDGLRAHRINLSVPELDNLKMDIHRFITEVTSGCVLKRIQVCDWAPKGDS